MHGIKQHITKPGATREPAETGRRKHTPAALLLALAIVCVTVAAYTPVLFNFFVGDDFVHLSWLSQATHHPELLWRNFHSSWLDGTTTKFYRPLISVFMYTDYLIGGANGLAFHVTNLVFHLLATVFLFLIVRHMGLEFVRKDSQETSVRVQTRALIAATLFGLYPLHPEAVSWITGRVDSIVSAFCLAAIWCYMRWRATSSKGMLALALGSCTLGLLSKEMAITLPAVFLCKELFLPDRSESKAKKQPAVANGVIAALPGSAIEGQFRNLLNLVAPTLPFWALLAAYFVVRLLALGTFVGGYDNSLFFIANMREFLLTWLHALRMFVEPINRSLLGSRDPLTKGWELCLALSATSGAAALFLAADCRRQILFTASWLALSLVPVYKIFAISDDLQGSRLAYLATAPLCVLFAFACVSWQRRPVSRGTGATLGCVMAALCFLILRVNNQPWIDSGNEANAIRAALQDLYCKKVSGDPQVLLIGLPDQTNGAYTCRNSLDGMTKRPQLGRDVANCLMVNPFEPIFPFGYLKQSIATEQKKILVFRWNSSLHSFSPVTIPSRSPETSWRCDAPYVVVHPVGEHPAEVVQNSDGSVNVRTVARSGEVEVTTGPRHCWSTDFIQTEIQPVKVPSSPRAGLELLYANDLAPNFELKRRAHADFASNAESEQVLTFALRGLPEWSFGGEFQHLRLLIPPQTEITINEIRCPDPSTVMPLLSFENSGYLGSKGYLHLGPTETERELKFDASKVPGCSKAELEITRANLLFEEQNSTKDSAVQWKKVQLASTSGTTRIRFEDFKSPGIYELRLRALDNQDRLTGVTSDHIVISVDAH